MYPYSEPAYSRRALGLELSLAAVRLAGGSRELQLQLRAWWGYAGLERVRCTSRPSVCPRLASFLPSALSLLPLLLFCPPSSSTLLSSSFSSFSTASCLLILAPDDDYFPFPSRQSRRVTYKLASHMDTHGRDASVCVCMRMCAPRRAAPRVCMRVSASPRLVPFEKRRYDMVFR